MRPRIFKKGHAPKVVPEGTAPASGGRVMPDPLRETSRRAAYVWRANQKRRTPSVPRLGPGEAEALAAADHARRQAEEHAERGRIKAELAAEKARYEAGVERPCDNSPESGRSDVRDMKF